LQVEELIRPERCVSAQQVPVLGHRPWYS
jgi:hypothetical protein